MRACVPRGAVRAVRMGACNLYHACAHNMLHEKSPEVLGALLKSGNRTAAGPTVPPGGLYLTRLWYDDGKVSFHVE